MKKSKQVLFPPLIFNVFKPAGLSSYDVVRHFKRQLPDGYGKIGHFGTLDPFASGILMIGIAGAARLNDLVHEYLPKTYLAVGKLGIETPTGDPDSEIIQRDETLYLKQEIARLPADFIQTRIQQKFLGEYWQQPHKYSATKFEGKNLHEWAREGIEIRKPAVLRHVYRLEVVKFVFPYLVIRAQVSSGTYIRTLFSEISHELGTIGSLIALTREKIGEVDIRSAIRKKAWPQNRSREIINTSLLPNHLLPFSEMVLSRAQDEIFSRGGFLPLRDISQKESGRISSPFFWMKRVDGSLIGLAECQDEQVLRPKINFNPLGQAESAFPHDL